MSATHTTGSTAELWPRFSEPSHLSVLEQTPLSARGLPANTYELVRRAAELWPGRTAISVLPDAERFRAQFVRTFGELADDVHRAATVLSALGVRRGDAVSVVSVNCAEMLPLLLAAESVGIYAPINPGLAVEHAIELVFAGYRTRGRSGRTLCADGKLTDGWLDTGDLGSVDADGFIRLAGRAKDLIIRGGHNIDPASIEDALLDHPDVTAVAAVGRPDAHAGEVPVAFVALRPGSSFSCDELEAWAAAHVPERAAAPSTSRSWM